MTIVTPAIALAAQAPPVSGDGSGNVFGIVMLGVIALVGFGLVLGLFCVAALLGAVTVRSIRPGSTARGASLVGSSLLPILSLALFFAAFSTALEPDFRGPEVLGIAIAGIAAMFSVMIGWPVSYFVTRRVMARRWAL